MAAKETIQLRDLTARVEEERFVMRMKVFNPKQRTLHAYKDPRHLQYDNVTGKLTLYLHDQTVGKNSTVSHHLPEPSLAPLEGKTETEIKISLPKVMNRFKSAAERSNSGPIIEQLRIYEAKEIYLEIAYNDTPFYENPKADTATELKEWGRSIAKASFKLSPFGQKDNA
jgi:hypothetical protein